MRWKIPTAFLIVLLVILAFVPHQEKVRRENVRHVVTRPPNPSKFEVRILDVEECGHFAES